MPLGLVGGAVDSIGGGGWGPIGTTTLLSSGRLEPRKVVGSIDTSEFVVAIGGSLGFLLALGSAGIDWTLAAALLAGGAVAAPIAAWLVRLLPARILGVGAGGLIVLTNLKTLGESFGLSGMTVAGIAAGWLVVWGQLLVLTLRAERRARAAQEESPTASLAA
jgi:hypothetical protein